MRWFIYYLILWLSWVIILNTLYHENGIINLTDYLLVWPEIDEIKYVYLKSVNIFIMAEEYNFLICFFLSLITQYQQKMLIIAFSKKWFDKYFLKQCLINVLSILWTMTISKWKIASFFHKNLFIYFKKKLCKLTKY